MGECGSDCRKLRVTLEQQTSMAQIPARGLAEPCRRLDPRPVLERAHEVLIDCHGVGADDAHRIVEKLTPAGIAVTSIAGALGRQVSTSADAAREFTGVVNTWTTRSDCEFEHGVRHRLPGGDRARSCR